MFLARNVPGLMGVQNRHMPSDPAVVHKFSPNNGTFAGYAAFAMAVVLLGFVALQMRSVEGIRVALATLTAATAVWITIVRPRAYVTKQTLVLRNMVSDTHIPLASVEKVVMRQTLNVWVAGKRHMCIGIGKTRPQLHGRQRRSLGLPFGGLGGASAAVPVTTPGQDTKYEDFVVDRIRKMSDEARRDGLPGGDVRRVPAVPEIVGFLVLLAALGLSFLL